MEQTSTAGLTAALRWRRGTRAALAGGAWRRRGAGGDVRAPSPGALSLLPVDPARRRGRARCAAEHDGQGPGGPARRGARLRAAARGCSGSPTTRRSRGCASAASRWTWMRSGRWGRDSLAQTVEDRERLALLRADLRDLPERQRAALVLRELSGLSHEEIAVVLDSSARAVKQTIFEARAGLHECAEGRTMLCADVQRALSDGDGRVLRGRRMRAHVRSCRACRTVQDRARPASGRPRRAGAGASRRPPGPRCWPICSLGPRRGSRRARGTAAGAGGGVAATVATKAAIVAVATATLAGTGTVVRDAVTAPDRPPPAGGGRAFRREHPAGLGAGVGCARRAGAAPPGSRAPRPRALAGAADRALVGAVAPCGSRGVPAAGAPAAGRASSAPGAKGQAIGAGQARRRPRRTAVAPGPSRPRAIPPIRRPAGRRRRAGSKARPAHPRAPGGRRRPRPRAPARRRSGPTAAPRRRHAAGQLGRGARREVVPDLRVLLALSGHTCEPHPS